jgi:CHAD domain-containing protein
VVHGVFVIDSPSVAKKALEALQERFSTRRERTISRSVTYHDSFDWRLFRNGGTLSSRVENDSPTLVWETREGRLLQRMIGVAAPAFADELPAGEFREALNERLEMRRLLPVVRVEARLTTLRYLDPDRKTIARAVFQHGFALPPAAGKSRRRLPRTLAVSTPKGYESAGERVASFLQKELHLPRAESCELTRALAAIGTLPTTETKLRLQLEPQTTANAATRQILRALARMILINEDGTRRDLDSEFLHDFRVAVRRTRSALGQIKGVFAAERIAGFREEFKWLGTLTGPTRDMDVFLLKMPGYRKLLPEELRDDLAPLETFLQEHQRSEQRQLVAELDSPRYRELMDGWQAFLDEEAPSSELAPVAHRPVTEVASRRIRRSLGKVLRRGKKIQADSPAEDLHRLRIECKKLRYLLEFFASLYDREQIGRMVKLLKKLQDNLGDLNDLEIQQAKLRTFARQMAEEGGIAEATTSAIEQLVARLQVEQSAERRRFESCFAKFATKENRDRAAELFAERGQGT